MKKLHLICNAHLDPVWQWQWNEGAAAAISTFRVAAAFCEQFDGFVFNHNEALLYMWTKEYEPALFARIQKLVREGRWHIMGGWFLQPDCNLPSGESLARQILVGRRFFQEQFGVQPTTAVNFDSFGHTRGLVQILRQSGYDSYVFMRPDPHPERLATLPQLFTWEGFAGSSVHGYRLETGYNTNYGKAAAAIDDCIRRHPDKEIALKCWGIGDHGGGPSRLDLLDVTELIARSDTVETLHSTPEAYFADAVPGMVGGAHSDSLIPSMVGCYTSMAQVKSLHRRLENRLFLTEKIVSIAASQRLMEYPAERLADAQYDLLFNEFHDVVTGTIVKPSEDETVRMLHHGLEICDRLYNKAFFALSAGQPEALDGEIPILIYNPHPYPITDVFGCEFMLADQNWGEGFTVCRMRQKGVYIPCQIEKEDGNVPLDWRKRVAFEATLPPMSMCRFDCELYQIEKRVTYAGLFAGEDILFDNDALSVRVGRRSGLLESYRVGGIELLAGPVSLQVFADNEDPWRMNDVRIDRLLGQFTPMDEARAAEFAGVHADRLPALHVVENGDVRLVVEGLYEWNHSAARVLYRLPKRGTAVELEITVYWAEMEKMLKLALPSVLTDGAFLGQTAFGANALAADGTEQAAQQWFLARNAGQAFGLVNTGVYGCSMRDGVLYQNLLRSTAYTGHPLPGRTILMPDRFSYHLDQGERVFSCTLFGGQASDALVRIDRLAEQKNQKPAALCLFPSGLGTLPGSPLLVGGARADAFKRAEDGNGWILRLFNPDDRPAQAKIDCRLFGYSFQTALQPFEVRTYRLTADGERAVLLTEQAL